MGENDFRRVHDRKRYVTDIIFTFKGRTYAGTLKDLSRGGAFVMTSTPNLVDRLDVITISIPFTNGQTDVNRRARVLRKNSYGFAIEFI